MTLCSGCKSLAHTMELKMCKKCGKSSDQDRHTLKYCTTCATELGVCRKCGKKLTK